VLVAMYDRGRCGLCAALFAYAAALSAGLWLLAMVAALNAQAALRRCDGIRQNRGLVHRKARQDSKNGR
jgi:hypothetical protein